MSVADNGGVFKAKSQNNATRGARPIEDSRQTRTELPVDKRPAEQVQVSLGVGCFHSVTTTPASRVMD